MLEVYAYEYATNDHTELIPFRHARLQQYMVQLMGLVNNVSYRPHTTWTWTTSKCNALERDLKDLLKDWG